MGKVRVPEYQARALPLIDGSQFALVPAETSRGGPNLISDPGLGAGYSPYRPHRPLLADGATRRPPARPRAGTFRGGGDLLNASQAPTSVASLVLLLCGDCPLKTIP